MDYSEEHSPVDAIRIPDISKIVLVLRDLDSQNLLYIVPTNFLSEQAAREAEALIESLRPQVVAVEGSLKFGKYVRSLGEGEQQPLPSSMLQILVHMAGSTGLLKLAIQTGNTFVEAITGVPFLVDFLAVEDKARNIGARFCAVLVSPGLPFKPPVMRPLSLELGASTDSRGRKSGRDLIAGMVELAEHAKCEDPTGSVRSFFTMLEGASRGDEVAVEDLLRVRRCWKKVVERDRVDKLELGTRSLDLSGMPATLVSAENQRLTSVLRACTRDGTTVALVSAFRANDIKHFWDSAPVSEDASFIEGGEDQIYALSRPRRKESSGWMPSAPALIGLGTVGVLGYYRPVFVRRTLIVGGTLFTGMAMASAYGWARTNRMFSKLENAAQRAKMLGEDDITSSDYGRGGFV